MERSAKEIISDKLGKPHIGATFGVALTDTAFVEKATRRKPPPSASDNYFAMHYYFKCRLANADYDVWAPAARPQQAQNLPVEDAPSLALVPFAPQAFRPARQKRGPQNQPTELRTEPEDP